MSGDAEYHSLVQFLPWDTAFFGFKIGKIIPGTMTAPEAAEVCHWAKSAGFHCLYWLAAPTRGNALGVAHLTGFSFADLRLELSCPLPPPRSPLASASIRSATPADLPVLETIARETQRDTRFVKDLRFPQERASDLYATWIANDLAQHRVLVSTTSHHQPTGFISFRVDPADSIGHIGLLSVSEAHAGRGLGQSLIHAALRELAAARCAAVEVVTQGTNVAAQRAYQGCGFKSIRTSIWFHRWF